MQSESDVQLLGRYAQQGSEEAFAQIINRHADFVYSAALRQVTSPDLAGEIAQKVFLDLARKAGALAQKLRPEASLAGWLYRSTRFAALGFRREEQRREAREKQAMNELRPFPPETETALDWEGLRPWLDEAMSSLSDADRDALLLRFFKNQDFRAVGVSLGISDDAAQKRVSRALEKLRDLLARRGVTTSLGALSVALSTNAVQSAPLGLATAISTAIAASAATVPTTIVAVTKAFAMTTLQKAIIGAALAAAIGTGIHQARRASQLGHRLQELERQQAALSDQIDVLTRDRERALGQAASAREEIQTLRRGSAQSSRSAPSDATEEAVNSWLKRINLLKQRLQQTPQANTPELRFLKDLDWVEVASNTKLESEVDYRKALAELRRRAGGYFVEQLHGALGSYLKDSNGQWPQNISQLESYFTPSVDRAVWERWEIVPTSAFPGREFASQQVITEKSAVDPEFDSRHTIDGVGSGAVGPYYPYGHEEQVSDETKERQALKAALDPAISAFKLANGGKEPSTPADLQPYLTSPEQEAALQRVLAMMNQAQTVKYGANFRDSTVQPPAQDNH